MVYCSNNSTRRPQEEKAWNRAAGTYGDDWIIIDSSRSKIFLFLLEIYDITWSTATGCLRTGMDAWEADGIIMRLRAAVCRERADKRDRLLLYALVSKASHMALLGNGDK